jgi:hypothetical protein
LFWGPLGHKGRGATAPPGGKARRGLACIADAVKNVLVLDNDLRPTLTAAVRRPGGDYPVVYSRGFVGAFVSSRGPSVSRSFAG